MEFEVDILLDLDQHKLDICVVGHNDKMYKMQYGNIPQQQGEYVPHFNVHDLDIQLQIAQIPSSWFGIPKKNIF